MICGLSLNQMMNLFDPVKYFPGVFSFFFVPFFLLLLICIYGKLEKCQKNFHLSNFLQYYN